MQKQIKQITEIIISKEEAQAFLRALQYCRHRLIEHGSSGAISVGKVGYIQGLINELEEVI